MILVDTSVWISHLRFGNRELSELLEAELVLVHPFVIGELACGSLRNRNRILADLNALPTVLSATHDDVLHLLESRGLWSKGIGWIDGHLLASALISACRLWTLDGALSRAARTLGLKH